MILQPAFAVFSVLLFSLFAYAQSNPTIGPFANDRARAEFIFSVSNRLPEIHESQKYTADYMAIVQRTEQIAEQLNASPLYRSMWQSKAIGKTIIINPKQPTRYVELKDIEVQKLISRANQIRASYSTSLTPKQILEAAVRKSAQLPNLNAMTTGLVKCLPPEKQKDAYRLTDDTRLYLFRSSLPENAATLGFRATDYGLSATASKAEILSLYKSVIDAEKEALDAILANTLFSTNGLRWDIPADQVSFRIISIAQSKLEIEYSDRASFNRFQTLWSQQNKNIANYYNITNEAQLSPSSEPLTIVEQPAHFALFRGTVGNDCATKFNYANTLAPSERTFFIYDQNKLLKGYFSISEVLLDSHRKGLYVHSFNGVRVSKQNVFDILSALKTSLFEWNAHFLLLPAKSNSAAFTNFAPIESAFREIMEGQPTTKIEYYDESVRTLLDQEPFSEYEQMANNRTAIDVTKQPKLNDKTIEIKSFQDTHKPLAMTDLDPYRATIFYLKLRLHQNTESAKRLEKVLNPTAAQIQQALKDPGMINTILLSDSQQAQEFITFIEKSGGFPDDPNSMQFLRSAMDNPKISFSKSRNIQLLLEQYKSACDRNFLPTHEHNPARTQ